LTGLALSAGNWAEILLDSRFTKRLQARSNVNLKVCLRPSKSGNQRLCQGASPILVLAASSPGVCLISQDKWRQILKDEPNLKRPGKQAKIKEETWVSRRRLDPPLTAF